MKGRPLHRQGGSSEFVWWASALSIERVLVVAILLQTVLRSHKNAEFFDFLKYLIFPVPCYHEV